MIYKTSEWVSNGHSDKMADYISEYILDRIIEKDPKVRYAVEVQIKGNNVTLGGEVTTTAQIDWEKWIREAIAKEMGAKFIDGYQLRYIYFIDKSKEKDLTVPVLPFSMIDEMNARMYKGVSYKRNASLVQEQNSNFPVENGGATPTDSLHNIGENND